MPEQKKYLDYAGLQRLVEKINGLLAEASVDITDTTAYKISGATDNLALPRQSQMEVLEVRGNSIVSHNLWDKDTYPFTNNYAINDETGVEFSFSGYSSILGYVPLKANTQYTVWANVGTIQALFYDNSKTYISATSSLALNTFTTPNNTAYVRFCVINSSANQIMLNYGSQDLPYEPYFEGIKNSKNNLVNTGVNLCPNNWTNQKAFDGTTGDVVDNSTHTIDVDYIPVKPNTQYTLTGAETYNYLFEYDSNKNYIQYSRGTGSTLTITTTANTRYLRVQYESVTNIPVMLNYGSTAQAYQPYTAHTLTINETLRKWDYIKGGKKVIATSIKTFNGTENWNVASETTDRVLFYRDFTTDYEKVGFSEMPKIVTNSSVFENVPQQSWGNAINQITLDSTYNNTFNIGICIAKSLLTSYDNAGIKAYLSANNLTVYYQTTAPTITDYNEPLYLPVYMNGTEQQTGEVPYTLVRNYDISVRDQVITNVQVDAKQEEEIQSILKGLVFKTIDGISIIGSGNIETGDGKGTDLYATKLILMDGTNNIPVFITDWIMSNEELASDGVLTKVDGLQLLKDISEAYSSDVWVNHDIKENYGYWDGSQWQVAFAGASGVILDTNSELIRVNDNTGQQIGSDVYLSDIGDDDQSTYYFKAIARGDA